MGGMLLRAFDKTVWTYSLGVCGGRLGLMQIRRWEGAVGRCAGTVLRSATHDTICAEAGYGEKVLQRELLSELEKSDSNLTRWPRCGKPKQTTPRPRNERSHQFVGVSPSDLTPYFKS